MVSGIRGWENPTGNTGLRKSIDFHPRTTLSLCPTVTRSHRGSVWAAWLVAYRDLYLGGKKTLQKVEHPTQGQRGNWK